MKIYVYNKKITLFVRFMRWIVVIDVVFFIMKSISICWATKSHENKSIIVPHIIVYKGNRIIDKLKMYFNWKNTVSIHDWISHKHGNWYEFFVLNPNCKHKLTMFQISVIPRAIHVCIQKTMIEWKIPAPTMK